MGRHSGSKHSGAKPQARRTNGGSPRSRRSNHFQYRVFGDPAPRNKQEREPNHTQTVPRVFRTSGVLGHLSIREIDNFGMSLLRKPINLSLISRRETIKAIRAGLKTADIEYAVGEMRNCATKTELPYFIDARSLFYIKDGTTGIYRAYTRAAQETYTGLEEEMNTLRDLLGIDERARHRKIHIADFYDEQQARNFAEIFNSTVPVNVPLFTLGAIQYSRT